LTGESPASPPGPRRGRVDSYDAGRGLGVISADDGATYDFHATAIADGSRAIAAGTPVIFTVAAGHGGRYEARAVSPL